MTDRDTEPTAPAEDGGFLRRWSQRKQAVARGEVPPEPVPAPTAAPVPPPASEAREAAPLPDPATLTLADDFSGFLRPKVPAALKRQALAKLFSEAHFNQVDGLDIYMDDYNLIPDMDDADRGLLRHARAVLEPTPAQVSAPDADTPVVGTEAVTEAADPATAQEAAPAVTDAEEAAAPQDVPPTTPT
ncbi:DUF3306 domain-containing protein [Denitromonas sp.]|uniref:DUF3306 domain-containing protein n=1 Tax=Denitromonas sp. TaxID=2734609 RepID=UPI003A83B02D